MSKLKIHTQEETPLFLTIEDSNFLYDFIVEQIVESEAIEEIAESNGFDLPGFIKAIKESITSIEVSSHGRIK